MDPLDARALFPICEQHIHLNHAGVAPMSERVRAAVDQVTRLMSEEGYSPEDYSETLDGLREKLATLVGVTTDQVSITRGTAHGISLLARGLDWKPGDNVVGARLEYPANLFPWMAARDRGVELRLVEPDGGRVTPEAVLSLVDGRTRVVALSFVEFWNGYRVDLAEIGAECRERGVILAVDGIQGLGVLPFSLEALNADFVAAGAGKWLTGPPGVGFTAWRPELLERIDPLLVGTGSMKDRYSYFNPVFAFEKTARKFEESALSWLDIAAFDAAVGLLQEVGIDVIAERVLGLSKRLAEGLVERGCTVIEPWPRSHKESSGIVSFNRPGMTEVELLRDLTAVGVICRTHRDFVRLSPHFYNTEEEIDMVLELLAPRDLPG
ncbi:MAG TPA: aminotransferase class V-fold PLP-dependent enzyme [Candidatus Dormibacteraeota bacterium]|nr:aminotransferase class V-fold PLP-dependent enzyme [Candidatus Dormibacteraeota bacterium]